MVFLFDVDAFKAINDTYGHQYGDECLHTIAAAIRETFSSVGLCYRIGGDEFCVLSEALDREKAADHLRLFLCNLERIQEKTPASRRYLLVTAFIKSPQEASNRRSQPPIWRCMHTKMGRRECPLANPCIKPGSGISVCRKNKKLRIEKNKRVFFDTQLFQIYGCRQTPTPDHAIGPARLSCRSISRMTNEQS